MRFALVLVYMSGAMVCAVAQTAPQLVSEAATEQSSYAARVLNRRDVHEVDPNIYVYGPEFAKKFQMPQEWVSTELKGVDAVAFRVVPSYKTCGWGGDPQACREDEVRCEMDLYFDHQRNPLPWDERRPERYSGVRNLSANFLWAGPNIPYQRLRQPARPGDSFFAQSSPFVDLKTGKGLGWQDYKIGNYIGGWVSTIGYDKEIFKDTSLVSLGMVCGSSINELWLASQSIYAKDVEKDAALIKRIVLPESWRKSVVRAQEESERRSKSFFKEEGEKALKALQDKPTVNKPLVPLQ
jgi:hypothetical protein